MDTKYVRKTTRTKEDRGREKGGQTGRKTNQKHKLRTHKITGKEQIKLKQEHARPATHHATEEHQILSTTEHPRANGDRCHQQTHA